MQLRVNLNLHVTIIGLYQKNGGAKKFIHSLPEAGDIITIERKNSSPLAKLWFKKSGEMLYFKMINQEQEATINGEFYYPIIEVPINPNNNCQKELTKIMETFFPNLSINYDQSKLPTFFSRGKIEITIL